MGASDDREWGNLLFGSYGAFALYYILWMFVTPFVDEDHFVLQCFPDRWWGLVIPSVLGCIFFSVVVAFIGLVLVYSEYYSSPESSSPPFDLISEEGKEHTLYNPPLFQPSAKPNPAISLSYIPSSPLTMQSVSSLQSANSVFGFPVPEESHHYDWYNRASNSSDNANSVENEDILRNQLDSFPFDRDLAELRKGSSSTSSSSSSIAPKSMPWYSRLQVEAALDGSEPSAPTAGGSLLTTPVAHTFSAASSPKHMPSHEGQDYDETKRHTAALPRYLEEESKGKGSAKPVGASRIKGEERSDSLQPVAGATMLDEMREHDDGYVSSDED